MKGRYEDETLKWIPFLILAVFLLPFILKGATFSYKYYIYLSSPAEGRFSFQSRVEILVVFMSLTESHSL